MHNTRYVTLYAGTITANTTSAIFNLGEGYTSWKVLLKVTAASGTSPTLNTYIQDAMILADGTDAFTDFISMTQLTTTSECWTRVTGSGEEMHAASDAALAAGQIRNGPVPSRIRVKFVKGGTNPSFTVELRLEAIP